MFQRIPIALAVLMFIAALARAAAAGDCAFDGFEDGRCERLTALAAKWRTGTLAKIEVTPARDSAVAEDERPNPDVDAANAVEAAREREIGPCRYVQGEERVEITADAFKLSDASLTRCLAAAYAQARYDVIEGRWLSQVGEHEAWVVRGGVLTKVSVERKLLPPAARGLWASLATRELLNTTPAKAEVTRAIATEKESPRSSDRAVRELLGL